MGYVFLPTQHSSRTKIQIMKITTFVRSPLPTFRKTRFTPTLCCATNPTPPNTHKLTIGTDHAAAFLLSSQVALTCHHATSTSPETPLRISSTSATLLSHCYQADMALLKLSSPLKCIPPSFDPAPQIGSILHARINSRTMHLQLLSVEPQFLTHSASRVPMLLLRAVATSRSSQVAYVQPGWSGAPVLTKSGAVAGMIVQSLGDLAHAVPCFLFDLLQTARLQIGYLPCLRVQQLLSRAARRAVQHDGVRVLQDVGALRKDDVLVEVAGYSVQNDATVNFNGLIAHFQTPVAAMLPGSDVKMRVFRNGQFVSLMQTVRSASDASSVPVGMVDRVVHMGNFVFTELSWEYLHAWGENWEATCPPALLTAARAERGVDGDQVVVLTSVVDVEGADSVHFVLQELHERVLRIDGSPVRRLEDLLVDRREELLVELHNGHVLLLPPGRLERARFQTAELDSAAV